jgi:hypothetical protein
MAMKNASMQIEAFFFGKMVAFMGQSCTILDGCAGNSKFLGVPKR